MAIFRKTLKEEFIITLVFCVVLPITIFFAIQEFQVAKYLDFSQFIQDVPGPLKKIAESFLVLNVFGGYLHIVVCVNWIIITSFYICVVSSGLIAREYEQKTLGLLLSYPVSRLRVILEKYLGSVFYLFLMVAAGFLGFYVGTYHGILNVPYEVSRFLVITANGFAFFLCLASISLFFSVLFTEHQKAAVASLLFFFLSYSVYFLGAFSSKWAKVRQFTLFRYFDTEKLCMASDLKWGNIQALIIIAMVFLAVSVVIFHKKDITG
ncbi:MAG: ABC transporter permease [Vulcanimicrobiota bacterium]